MLVLQLLLRGIIIGILLRGKALAGAERVTPSSSVGNLESEPPLHAAPVVPAIFRLFAWPRLRPPSPSSICLALSLRPFFPTGLHVFHEACARIPSQGYLQGTDSRRLDECLRLSTAERCDQPAQPSRFETLSHLNRTL